MHWLSECYSTMATRTTASDRGTTACIRSVERAKSIKECPGRISEKSRRLVFIWKK